MANCEDELLEKKSKTICQRRYSFFKQKGDNGNRPIIILLLVLFINSILISSFAQTTAGEPFDKSIQSPDNNLLFHIYRKASSEGKTKIHYELSYKRKPVILESALEIQLDNHLSQLALALKTDNEDSWGNGLVLERVHQTTHDSVWYPINGERSQIRDYYNELIFFFKKSDDERYKVNLIVRVYNEGVAVRYYFPDNPTGVYYRINSEHMEFTFPEKTQAWYEQWAQGPFKLMPLEGWPDESERPLTLQLNNGLYTCLAEAAMVDYVRTKFSLKKDKPNSIVTSLYEPVDLIPYFNTPWRVIMVGEKPGDLIEHNSLLLNLNAPSKIQDISWIKPGKIIREMTLTNEGAKACIDFAADHNLQYILFDWKWYGPTFTFDSDARKVAIDLDLQNIIQYGAKKNVGIWLYVNQQALLKQDHELFPLYKRWGVKGVKYGFVQVGSHRWTTWLHQSIQRAAENELMVNIHDEFRTTGEQRTWPNIMTVEGIRGNEEMPDANHNTILPFTRGISGAGDYTICYYSNRIKTTHAHQLGLGVVNYSPLQTLFWYDKPSDYQGEPEIEFFEKLPTVWDETKVLQGEVGQYIIMARKHAEEWFVGAITNNQQREISIPMDFLPKGKKFLVNVYSDDAAAKTRTKVKVEQRMLKSGDMIKFKLEASGGIALWIRPESAKEQSKAVGSK